MKKLDSLSAIILALLILTDGYVWYAIVREPAARYQIDFLDVGQGDSQLLTLQSVRIVTDAGPDKKVVASLAAALPPSTRYIDLGIITHPEKDHYGGFTHLLDQYTFGAILWNGFAPPGTPSPEWQALQAKIAEKHIPFVVIGAGDTIAYGSSTSNIFSPDTLLLGSGATNDTGIVQKVTTPDFTALLTADIGFSVEDYLTKNHDLTADILKIGHHGSRFSTGETFLSAVMPQIAVIQDGKGNTYGHPAPETLARLASSSVVNVFRTDEQGTITISRGEEGLIVR